MTICSKFQSIMLSFFIGQTYETDATKKFNIYKLKLTIVQMRKLSRFAFVMFSDAGMYFKNKQAIIPTDRSHKRGKFLLHCMVFNFNQLCFPFL